MGLKIQAAYNDPQRANQDWLDIQLLIQAAGASGHSLDWELINDYLSIFGQQDKLTEIQAWYDPT